MKDKILKKFGKGGLIAIGLLFFVGLLFVATQNPAAATGGAAVLMFGMATAVGSDSSINLRTLKYTHSAALVAGDPIVYNGGVIVAVNDTALSVENVFIYKGKMTFPKEAPLVISLFDLVYWDATNAVITKTAGGNTACGYCVEAAASADTTVTIMLRPSADITTAVEAVEQAITDPGDGLAIPVVNSGVCAITTAGSETRTLAIPTKIGQVIMLMIDTDGGTCVITSAQAINQAGNNTITMAEVNDNIVLIAGSIGGALRWRVLANDGAALSTV